MLTVTASDLATSPKYDECIIRLQTTDGIEAAITEARDTCQRAIDVTP